MENIDKYAVHGPDGEILTYLNPGLAKRQGLSDEEIEALKLSHQVRWLLFETAKHDSVKNDKLKLRLLASLFDTLEFEQQELWHFPRDVNFHHWFEFPGCICPKIDNRDALGSPMNYHTCGCPIHGG
jgi:hypothetical protein